MAAGARRRIRICWICSEKGRVSDQGAGSTVVVYLNLGGVAWLRRPFGVRRRWMREATLAAPVSKGREFFRAGGSMHTQQYFEPLSSRDNDEGGRWISKKIIDSRTIKSPTLRIAMIGRGSLLCTVVKLEIFLQIRSSFVLEACTPPQSSSSRVAAPASNDASSFTDHRRYVEKRFIAPVANALYTNCAP